MTPMHTHPLKIISLISVLALLACQLGLILWLDNEYRYLIATTLGLPLLIPIRGLIMDRRYTYKWVGFLTLLYFSIGVSESFANPALRTYSVLSILFSCLLFIGSVYYSRYLRMHEQEKVAESTS